MEEHLSGMFPVLKYFSYDHLPEPLRGISEQCHALAWTMAQIPTPEPGPANRPEIAAGLRKLLEAKDCFVRAALEGWPERR